MLYSKTLIYWTNWEETQVDNVESLIHPMVLKSELSCINWILFGMSDKCSVTTCQTFLHLLNFAQNVSQNCSNHMPKSSYKVSELATLAVRGRGAAGCSLPPPCLPTWQNRSPDKPNFVQIIIKMFRYPTDVDKAEIPYTEVIVISFHVVGPPSPIHTRYSLTTLAKIMTAQF